MKSRRLLWLVMALTAVAVLQQFGRMPLLDPDEGRNSEVAREMWRDNEWVVPQYHGLPYLDKPALYFDALALSFRLFGASEASARLVSLLFAMATLAVTWRLARDLGGSASAAESAVVLATSPLFLAFSRTVIFDMALVFFVVLAWLCAEAGRRGRWWGFPGFWAATGLAVLTKGPIGLLLPILGHAALSWRRRPRRLRELFHLRSLAAFVVVVAPWVFAVESRHPGFLRYALVVETAERLTRPTFHRTGPITYFLPVLLLGFLPWSLVLVGRLIEWGRTRAGRRDEGGDGADRDAVRFGLVLAVAAITVFFSLSSSKLAGYILPAFPLLAILVGGELAAGRGGRGGWCVVPGAGLTLLGVLLLAVFVSGGAAHPWLRVPAAGRPVLLSILARAGVLSLAGGIVLLVPGWTGRRLAAPRILALYTPLLFLLIAGPVATLAEDGSARRLARDIRAIGGGEARIACLFCFPPGLDFYAGRIVPVVTTTGRELTSNYVLRNFADLAPRHPDILWTPEEFHARAAAGGIDVVVSTSPDPPAPGFDLARDDGWLRLWRKAAPRPGME